MAIGCLAKEEKENTKAFAIRQNTIFTQRLNPSLLQCGEVTVENQRLASSVGAQFEFIHSISGCGMNLKIGTPRP